MTCWRRLRDWYQAGVWRRLHQVLLEELAQADRIDWDRAAWTPPRCRPRGARNGQEPNGSRQTGHEAPSCGRRHGIPLAVLVSAANVHDSKMMLATVDAIEPIRAKTRGRPRRRPHKLHADKGYDYRHLRLALRSAASSPASPAVVSSPRTAWDATAGWSNGRYPGSTASGA